MRSDRPTRRPIPRRNFQSRVPRSRKAVQGSPGRPSSFHDVKLECRQKLRMDVRFGPSRPSRDLVVPRCASKRGACSLKIQRQSFQRRLMVWQPAVNRVNESSILSAGARVPSKLEWTSVRLVSGRIRFDSGRGLRLRKRANFALVV